MGLSSFPPIPFPLSIPNRVEPIIYRNVVLSSPRVISSLYRTITSPNASKNAAYLGRHVKFLAVTTIAYGAKELFIILSACISVRVLSFWGSLQPSYWIFRQLFSSPHISPTRLSFTGGSPEGTLFVPQNHWLVEFSLPIFRNLTHLEVVRATAEPWNYWTRNGLSALANLTHLSVYQSYPPPDFVEVANGILAQCPTSLRILIVGIDSKWLYIAGLRGAQSINKGDVDLRVVMLVQSRSCEGDLQKDHPQGHFEYAVCRSNPDWRDDLRDWTGKAISKDLWEMAEEKIAQRNEWLRQVCSDGFSFQ